MSQRFTPHTIGLIIATLSKEKRWHGTRRGLTITLKLDQQTDIEGNRVRWTAYPSGHYSQAARGSAATVVDAIGRIELILRDRLNAGEEQER